eukprot:403349625
MVDNHIDTVNHFSPYGKSGMLKDLGLSPGRTLGSSLSLPFISPIGMGGIITPTKSMIKLPSINPVLQSAGLQTINSVNPLNAAGNPLLPPPVPLLPPSLFGSVPSLPDLRNPHLSDWYWRGRNQYLGGDYVRGRGGVTGLGIGDLNDPDKVKKALYRNDLLNQMDDNKVRRLERYNLGRIENEYEEDRLRRERSYLDRGLDWNIGERRRRIMDNQERVARHLKENWHRRDEDQYNYKRFRKGSEPVEAWWLGDPHHHNGYDSRYWRKNGHGPHPDHWDKKYWSHPAWWNSKDPYPYPPVKGGPHGKDWWWYGDQQAPWKEKGYWHQGKWVPMDVANHIQERVGKEVEKLRGEMTKNEMDLQQQLNEMKKQSLEADYERAHALAGVKHLKEKLNDQQLTEDIRHQYIYNQMLNSMQEKDQLMKARTEVLPEITTMSKIDKVQFKVPTRPSERYDDLNPLPKSVKFVNDRSAESLDKMNTKVKILDGGEYLNNLNTKRLDDLKSLDTRTELAKDKLAEYLERESSASRIHLHQEDVRNSLLNRDILINDELPNTSNYQTPLKVASKFDQKFPGLDELQYSTSKFKTPITQKIIIKSQSQRYL